MILVMLNKIRVDTSHALKATKIIPQLGSIDLTGAEFEYGQSRLNILQGRLGRVNPSTSLANGHLSIISHTKPSLFLSRAQIIWQNLEFELMMILIEEFTLQAELKLKFVARWTPLQTSKLL